MIPGYHPSLVDPDLTGVPCAHFREGATPLHTDRSPDTDAGVAPPRPGSSVVSGCLLAPSGTTPALKARNGAPLDDAPTTLTPPALDTGAADGPVVGNGGAGHTRGVVTSSQTSGVK